MGGGAFGLLLASNGVFLSLLFSIFKIFCRSSDAWKNTRRRNINSQFEQYGNIAIAVNIEVPFDDIAIIATSLICSGKVLTMEFIGALDNELDPRYLLHSHNNTKECDDNCVKTELKPEDYQMDSKFISIYLAHISQKSYVTNWGG